jgi:hypothetical protein
MLEPDSMGCVFFDRCRFMISDRNNLAEGRYSYINFRIPGFDGFYKSSGINAAGNRWEGVVKVVQVE